MKICLKCNRGLLDRDLACDKCGCLDIMDKTKYQYLYNKFKESDFEEQQLLRETEEYKIICKYKFKIDLNNTPEKRQQQSENDRYLNKQQKRKLKQEFMKMQEKSYQKQTEQIKFEKEQNTPKCPTCGSTNVNKISTAKKAAGFLTVGVFSSNLGKTMECKNCGYKW